MDTFNFLVSILLIFLALQYQQSWMVFAILVLSVLTIKSFRVVVGLVIGALVLYLLLDYENIQEYLPLVVLGIVVIALILGIGKGESEQQPLSGGFPGLYGGETGLGGGLGY